MALFKLVLAGYDARIRDYQDRLKDLTADRDAWRDIAERGSWLAESSTRLAERTQRQPERLGPP